MYMLSEEALAHRESKYRDTCFLYGWGYQEKQISIEKKDLHEFKNDFDGLILYAFQKTLPGRTIRWGTLFPYKERTLLILHKHHTYGTDLKKNKFINSDSGWMRLWGHKSIKKELQNIWGLRNSRNVSIIFPLRFNFCMDGLI